MAYSPDGYGEPGATTIIQRSYDDVVHTPRRLSIDGDDPLEGDDGVASRAANQNFTAEGLNLTHAGLGAVPRTGRDRVRAAGAGVDRRALPVAPDRHCADLSDDAAVVELLKHRLSIHLARARRACPH